jgi:transaldolase
MADPLTDLTSRGVSIWLDDLSRERLVTGSLADLAARDHVVGVTTNPTIFAKAISGGDAYAEQVRDLWARGAIVGEALWASTSVKDPAYPDTRYVTDLVAPGVVNTMPEATLRAVADHGVIPKDSVRGHYAEARQVLSDLEAIGVDYGEVTDGLETNGLAAFDASWREVGDQIAARLRRPSGASGASGALAEESRA